MVLHAFLQQIEKIANNEQRIIDLEDRESKLEKYKIFLYPIEIKKYIQNLIDSQRYLYMNE